MTTRTYVASARAFLGGLRVEGAKAIPLPGRTTVTVSPEGGGSLQRNGKYDPPGSGWIAVGLTVVTGIAVVVMTRAWGCVEAAAPGWLALYLIVTLVRRRDCALELVGAESVVLDAESRSVAFRTAVDGSPAWVALRFRDDFDAVAADVRSLVGPKVKVGRIGSAGVVALAVLGAIIVALIAFAVIVSIQLGRR